MLHASLLIEILRAQPRLVFWFVTLAQAVLWVAVPALFYSAPPGSVAEVLAISHNLGLTWDAGPPLAYWLADLAFALAGNRIIGIYVLAQLCVVATYWAVFILGRDMIGPRLSVLAILLMAGVSALSVPTPDYGPTLLMMPFWAFAALFLYRAADQDRRLYWFALVAALGLMLLTSYLSLVLIGLLFIFIADPRLRVRLRSIEAALASLWLLLMIVPVLIAFAHSDYPVSERLLKLRNVETLNENLIAWLRLAGILVLSNAGLVLLGALAGGAILIRDKSAPAVEGKPATPFARAMIYYLAIVPPIVVTVGAAAMGYAPALNAAPLLIFVALAVVVAAGQRVRIHNQRALPWALGALLVLPPVLVAIAVAVFPVVFGIDLKVAQPAGDLAKFFSENFQRRTGRPLAIVGGDRRLALLIASAARSRPAVLIDDPAFPKQVTDKDIAEQGAVIVWPAANNTGLPPADIRARFPDLAREVTQSFERTVQGRLPVLRIGWAMIRPAASAPAQ
jgi:4-amino-4-deoxy-L-arabinose transferase-like glycosyltransferase